MTGMDFTGRTVLITGAGGGIGSALCRRFLQEGARVFAVDREPGALDALDIPSGADQLVKHVMDVSDEAACTALAELVDQRWGGLHVLVNNAGYFPTRAFSEMTYAEWRQVCTINLDSVFLVSKSLLPLMIRSGGKRIINMGSGSVLRGPANQSHYVAAKAGVHGFTRSLANEVGVHGITVNVVAPGLTATAAAETIFTPEQLQARVQSRAIKRVQTADDVVGAVVFLASDDAAFITGQMLPVNGGATMHG